MFGFGRKTPAATQVVPTEDQIRIREELIGTQAQEIKELNAALLNRNKELINLRAEKAKVGKALSEALAERDEARAQLVPFLARREKAKQNLRQFRAKSAPTEHPVPGMVPAA